MDTRREILRDEWIENHRGHCALCGWRKFESVDRGYICCCNKSPHVADWVEAEDSCTEYYENRKSHD